MKKTIVMIMAGIMLVAMVACGKDAGANQPQSDQTADEELEMLNAEINAMMEAEQRQAEEREQRAQQAAEEYPEGVLPEGDYWCYEVQDVYKNGDDQSPLYYTPIELEIYSDDVYLKYEYDAETKEYIIVRRYSPYLPNKFADWDHIFIGYLDEEGNLIVTHYERINYAYSGNWQEVVLDDIEWVYVRESADNISDNIEPTDVSEVAIQDLVVTLTQGVYECADGEGYSLETIELINNKEYFCKMNGDGTNLLLFYNPNNSNSWCFHIEGDLVENNLVINYFVRYDAEKLYDVLRTVAVPDMIQRFEEEYPDVADLILDDIEWVYVLQED